MKKFNPKVSIIIPVYNGSNYLREAIDSALAQTYKNLEIIVSNDGSNDNGATEKIAKSYGKKIIYLNKKENGGAATALNLAIGEMTGEYFSWLSHDDMYYPNKIQRQIEELDKLSDKNTIIMSDLDAINEKYEKIYQTNYISHINEYPLRAKSYIHPVIYNQTHGCTLLIPKICFDEVGLFDIKEIVAQDFEFFNRVFSKFPHKLVSEILVTARDSSNRMGRRAKPRASVEYSRLYISIIDNLSDEDIKLLSLDKLSLYYDMYNFFNIVGYESALKYITEKISDQIPLYLHNLFSDLMNDRVDLVNFSQSLSRLRIYLGIWSNTEDDTIDSLDLILSKILLNLSSVEIEKFFSNNLSKITLIYESLSLNGYKRTAAYLINNLVGCSIKRNKLSVAVNIIQKELIGGDIDIEENEIDSFIKKIKNKSNKKRLLFCSTHWLTGGMERVMSNLFNQLKTDYDIYLITPFDGRKGLVVLPDYVTHIKISNSSFYSNFDGIIFSYATLFNIDVAIGLFNLFDGILNFYKLCQGTKIKTISSNQEYYFYPYKNVYLTDIVSKRLNAFQDVDAVLWPTNFNAAVYGLNNNNVYLVTDPNTFEIQKDVITKKDQKMILCVGRFNDYTKRIDRILNCFKIVLSSEPEAKLMIVGPCDRNAIIKPGSTSTINDLISRLDIDEKSMIFIGEVSDVRKYYSQASLLLLTSNNEGFGMVINEAACYGVPSVCNSIPGIEDLVIDGENGYIVEQDDLEAMSNYVCKILSDNNLREILGKNAKKIVKKFDAKTVGNTWKFLIDTLLSGKSKEETRLELNEKLAYRILDNKRFSKILFNEINNTFEKYSEANNDININCDNCKMLYSSNSWKITKPIRLIKSGIVYFKHFGLLATTKKVTNKIYWIIINIIKN